MAPRGWARTAPSRVAGTQRQQAERPERGVRAAVGLATHLATLWLRVVRAGAATTQATAGEGLSAGFLVHGLGTDPVLWGLMHKGTRA